jgi:hypothetical protein
VDQGQQLCAELRLGHKAVGAHGLGRSLILRVVVQRQDDDARRARLRLDTARRLQTVHFGHGQVEQHQVRMQAGHLLQRIATRQSEPGDLDMRIRGQEAHGRLEKGRAVVHQEKANRHKGCTSPDS